MTKSALLSVIAFALFAIPALADVDQDLQNARAVPVIENGQPTVNDPQHAMQMLNQLKESNKMEARDENGQDGQPSDENH